MHAIVGTWELVSFESRVEGGDVFRPYGPNPVGILHFLPNGYMSAHLMTPARPKFAAGALFGTPEEKVAAFDTYTGYTGPYRIEGATLTTRVEASDKPDWVGTDQVRLLDLTRDKLELRTPPMSTRNGTGVLVLAWKRRRS